MLYSWLIIIATLCYILCEEQKSTKSYPCNIEIVHFDENDNICIEYPDVPVIFKGKSNRNANLRSKVERTNLIDKYGLLEVSLSSANTYSHELKKMSLAEYLHFDVLNSTKLSNESFYLFGNNYGGLWDEIVHDYVHPPCRHCKSAGIATIGAGLEYSGVLFHYHGPCFSEVIIGRKRWFLYPYSHNFIAKSMQNITMKEWFDIFYPSQINYNTSGLYECVIEPGELLYFPDKWLHGTLNIDSYNFFVSLFLDIQMLKD